MEQHTTLREILEYNKEFVDSRGYEKYFTDVIPNKRTAIVTCMDCRLTELLPAAMGIKNGDVKIIANAGAMIRDPWGDTMRSILVAIYELQVDTIMIVAHTHCGVEGLDGHHLVEIMKERGVSAEKINLLKLAGIDLEEALEGFTDMAATVHDSVALVANHPLVPEGITVVGFIIDTVTGKLNPVK